MVFQKKEFITRKKGNLLRTPHSTGSFAFLSHLHTGHTRPSMSSCSTTFSSEVFSSTQVQQRRLAATRENTLSIAGSVVPDTDFQECRKLSDKDLAERIQKTPSLGKVRDNIREQHLIHWCVVTGRANSVIAICTAKYSLEEVNVKDGRGRTPLHLAVIGELEYMATLLLSLGALTTISDNSAMMPIHYAASIGNIRILRVLISKSDSLNTAGDGGYTALHFAAAADRADCIQLLLQNKASMLIRSSNGTYPVHVAAKSGAANALQALITGAESMGIDHRLLLSLKDKEGQLPIHNAVNNGAAEVVLVCLNCGSSLLSRKDSGSTPVHYAAKQGNLELLKTMYDFNSETYKEALQLADITMRTPLHWASMFDHHQVVKYLIKMSNVNTVDINNQTPLLTAATNGCWETLAILLMHRETNTEFIDKKERNVLHQAVIQKMNLEESFYVWKQVRDITQRCNEQDKTGSTPLHYAAWNGRVRDVQALLNLGANTNVKNKLRQNPFHIACKNGCYDVCLLLLNDKAGSRLKNEQDDSGDSPLHMAAAKGYTPIVNILLQRGAIISKSKTMATALHLAAAGGHIRCVHSLLSVHLDLLDAEDCDGNTALHLAAANGHAEAVSLLLSSGAEITYNVFGKCFYDDALTQEYSRVLDVCIVHERWQEILSVFSQYHGQLILGLITYLPYSCVKALDRCVHASSNDKNSVDYEVQYNFRYLQLGEEYSAFAKVYKLRCSPLLPVELMLQHKRDELLRHELVTVYLHQKWKSYGRMVNFLDICIYCMFMGSLTMFVVTHDPLDHYHTKAGASHAVHLLQPVKIHNSSHPSYFESLEKIHVLNFTDKADFEYSDTWFPPEAAGFETDRASKVALLVVCIYSATLICKSIVQIFSLGFDYMRDISLYLELGTYCSALYFAFPFLLGYSTHTQWEAASIAIFMSWFNFLVLCQRFQMFGLYIVMYMEIMKTLLQILFIFLVLIIAFGLAFFILQSKEKYQANSTPLLSMYRMLILLFEIEYVQTIIVPYFDSKSDTMHFPQVNFVFMTVFLLFMPVLLVNLMIGLAVGDIQSVLRYAHQQKLRTQVNFHTKLERKLPFLMQLTPEMLTLRPNEVDNSMRTWFMYLIGLDPLHEYKKDSSSSSYSDRMIPILKSVLDLRQEVQQLNMNTKQIMRKLGVANDDYYTGEQTDEMIADPSLDFTNNQMLWKKM